MKALLLCDDGFRLYADSAAHRNRHPLFLPDHADGWTICICPCVRISRLGMCISEAFASRYYDAIGVAAVLTPTDAMPDFQRAPERYFAMDSAYTLSDFSPVDDSLCVDAFGQTMTFDASSLKVDEAVARLSSFMTFKTGDLLIFANSQVITAPVNEGDEVVVNINNKNSLDVRIK